MQSALHWLAPGFAVHGVAAETVLHWLALGLVLVGTLAVGICAHELLHVVPLSLADASYTVTLLPSDDASDEPTPTAGLRTGLSRSLVRVEVTHVPESTPEWLVRTAAILPVALALPFALVAAGVLPDPIAGGDHLAAAALIALTGCGLPSPADWSVVWHGSRLADD